MRGDTVLRAGRRVAASGDGFGEPVLLWRDVGASVAYDGWNGGVVRRYHRAGGIVTRRRRRPSPFPFSLLVARTNTRTRVLRLAGPRSIPIHTRAHARTYTLTQTSYVRSPPFGSALSPVSLVPIGRRVVLLLSSQYYSIGTKNIILILLSLLLIIIIIHHHSCCYY